MALVLDRRGVDHGRAAADRDAVDERQDRREQLAGAVDAEARRRRGHLDLGPSRCIVVAV